MINVCVCEGVCDSVRVGVGEQLQAWVAVQIGDGGWGESWWRSQCSKDKSIMGRRRYMRSGRRREEAEKKEMQKTNHFKISKNPQINPLVLEWTPHILQNILNHLVIHLGLEVKGGRNVIEKKTAEKKRKKKRLVASSLKERNRASPRFRNATLDVMHSILKTSIAYSTQKCLDEEGGRGGKKCRLDNDVYE